MQVDISGHHVDITDAIRSAVNSKLSKVASHYPDLTAINAILTVEKQSQKIEVTTQYLGNRVSVHSANNDMYTAITDAAKKLESSLSHRKGSIKNFKHEKPELAPAADPKLDAQLDAEEEFEEI